METDKCKFSMKMPHITILVLVIFGLCVLVPFIASSRRPAKHLQQGKLFYNQGNFTEAISELTKVIKISPGIADAYLYRGFAFGKQKRFAEAIADFTKAIELSPDSADGYIARGIVNCHEGNCSQGISDCTKAIGLKPKSGAAYYYRSLGYLFSKEYDKSWADVHKAESLGYKINHEFLAQLKKESGRDK